MILPFGHFKPAAAGGGTFAPDDISDLALWLDASDTSTITESSGAVSQWDDKSTNGRDVSQGSGTAQPTTGSVTINGLNAIDFDGSDDTLINSSPFIYDTSFTMFVVLNAVQESDTRFYLEYGGGAPVIGLGQKVSSGNNPRIYYRNDSYTNIADKNFNNSSFMNSTNKIGVLVDSGSALTWYTDGVPDSGGAQGYTASGTYTVNTAYVGSGAHMDGAIGEFIIYDRVLTTSELNQVGQYLDDKWGITWTDIT